MPSMKVLRAYIQNIITDDNTRLPDQNIESTHFMILLNKLDNYNFLAEG